MICGYAVDMGGILVDAVVVEKDKARQTFESEARKVEKPSAALIEQVQGNIFKVSIATRPSPH